MEPDGDSVGSIESFFSSLQSSEHSPRNLSQIFEDDLLPMQRESRNLRYQPGGHRAQQKPQKPQQPPPTTSPAVSSERNSVVAVVEKTPSRRWSVAFAKIVNIYNGYHPAERMCLALTMLGENEAATMILYKQKTQTISNTKLKPNGKTVHFRDNYVQFYDDTRKYWSLRFVEKADEEGFVEIMTTNGWPLEQHSSRSEDDVEQQQQEEEEEEHSVEHPQQNRTEQLRDPTEKLLLSDQNSEQFKQRIERMQQQLKKQLRDQHMERLHREQLERNERYGKLHSEQNREQLREQNREQLREQNREQLREQNRDQNREQLREQNREQLREQNREQQDLRNREQRVEQIREQLRHETQELLMEQSRGQLRREENPAEHQEPRRQHTCYHHRHSRNNEEHHPEVPPQPMPRSRNLATSQDELGEKSSRYMECLRRHFMHLGCEHMHSAREQIPEEDLSSERMQSGREQIPEEDLSSERMQSGREQISEEDVIVTPMSIPIGSTSSRTSMEEHHRSSNSSSAVVQLPARRAETETTDSSRLLAKFINTHMGPEMKMQNILDAMQRLSEGRNGRNFNGNHDEDAPPQPQPRPSSSKDAAEDAEDRVLQLEQILLDAKKENRRLSKELKMRDDDLLSFQKSSLALMEKLITTNEDLEANNSRLVETIIMSKSKAKASKKENCINCERSAQEIVVLKRHINALELALRESE